MKDAVPLALAENSGLLPIETLSELKSRHIRLHVHHSDMKKQHVIEALHAKMQQIQLATQLVKMILKIDDVRTPNK